MRGILWAGTRIRQGKQRGCGFDRGGGGDGGGRRRASGEVQLLLFTPRRSQTNATYHIHISIRIITSSNSTAKKYSHFKLFKMGAKFSFGNFCLSHITLLPETVVRALGITLLA